MSLRSIKSLKVIQEYQDTYFHGNFFHKIPGVWIVKWNVIGWSSFHHKFPQHGSLFSDLFGQASSVNPWFQGKIRINSKTKNVSLYLA